MAKIKFERISAPTGSVEFSRNPSIRDGDYRRRRQYVQPVDFAGGGDPYIYNKGISPKDYIYLDWKNIPATDFSNFLTFLSVVNGKQHNFTFTSFDGATYTARIWNGDDIPSSPVATSRESLTVELLIES